MLVAQQTIVFDSTQQPALEALDSLWLALSGRRPRTLSKDYRGVYLWGNVGRGKTLLMNLFFETLPDGVALRVHFHHFMASLHRELNKTFGVSNPVKKIAKRMAKEVNVICFDEFFVSDIADAMLLQNMMQALFEEGVYFVATSNIATHDLFQSQLQKDRFVPAIELLNRHLVAFNLDGHVDYRYRLPIKQPTYFTDSESFLRFLESKLEIDEVPGRLLVNERPLVVKGVTEGAVWFDFSSLCESPRATQDYMALAESYAVIAISDIPELSCDPYEHIKARGTEDGSDYSSRTGNRTVELGVNDDAVRRFIALVDECYDQGVAMVFHAHVSLNRLYRNGALIFEFRRTKSRINEMQTAKYNRRSEL